MGVIAELFIALVVLIGGVQLLAIYGDYRRRLKQLNQRSRQPEAYEGPSYVELKAKLDQIEQEQKTWYDGGFGGGAH